jgi:2-oxoglutarate ferredoxin oxidoreductase subunit beta
MTGGQFSPLSGCGTLATTAPYGNIDRSFDVAELAMAAGAGFVARTTTYHVRQMTDLIKQAIKHKGFSVVEIMSQCPTYFGKHNDRGSAVDMMEYFKNNSVAPGSNEEKANAGLIKCGVFVNEERPEYCVEYDRIIETAKKGNG